MSTIHTPQATSTSALTGHFAAHVFWASLLPLINLIFLLTGPHDWWIALLWITPVWGLVLLDNRSAADRRPPSSSTRVWPFDALLYALVALQLLNHALLGWMASRLMIESWFDVGTMLANLMAVLNLSATAAASSGIVIAHELVHRRSRVHRWWGRVLLMFVGYEHFATEHIRGHHPRVATADDPATARHGESFLAFYKRTVPAQLKSAWRLEKKRLGDVEMGFWDRRMLQHRVLHGLLAETAIFLGYLLLCGPIGLLFFAGQARTAVILLETINYVEHWGLTRSGRRVQPSDSWDADSGITLYALVGLARHADHHAHASRPYHELRYCNESPKMPTGYYGTLLMAMMANERYQAYADAELKRLGLGPYRAAANWPAI
ncbi:MAG: fatty acid desaturase [Pseudomonadota bacterium]